MKCDIGKGTKQKHEITGYCWFFNGMRLCKKCADEGFNKLLKNEVKKNK